VSEIEHDCGVCRERPRDARALHSYQARANEVRSQIGKILLRQSVAESASWMSAPWRRCKLRIAAGLSRRQLLEQGPAKAP